MAERKLGQVVDRVTDRLSPEEQLEVLMDAYEQPLYAFLVVVVGTPDLAADCAQDTFLRAYQQLRRRRLVSKSWLYRVAHNRAMDEYRRREREQRKITRLGGHGETDTMRDASDGGLHMALLELSPEEREILYLWAVDGLSGQEIGDLLGIRADAAHMRVSRARRRFKAAYGGEL